MGNTEGLSQLDTWSPFFDEMLEKGLARREPVPGYGERIILDSTDRQVLEQITEPVTGRRRVELSPLALSIGNGDAIKVADRVGVITESGIGTHATKKDRPAGHTWMDHAERWTDQTLADMLLSASDLQTGWELVSRSNVTSPDEQGFLVETMSLGEGVLERHTIFQGAGIGRVWSVFRPHEPATVTLPLRDGTQVAVEIGLEYGITVVQGDVSDKKQRSPRGSTHYAIEFMGLADD